MREKVETSQNTVCFQCFVPPEGEKLKTDSLGPFLDVEISKKRTQLQQQLQLHDTTTNYNYNYN